MRGNNKHVYTFTQPNIEKRGQIHTVLTILKSKIKEDVSMNTQHYAFNEQS